jgi:hypothetical protein
VTRPPSPGRALDQFPAVAAALADYGVELDDTVGTSTGASVLSISTSVASVIARTVASRGSPVSRLISPNDAGPRTATSR